MKKIITTLLNGCAGLCALGLSAASGEIPPDKPVITGAGAHFAWVVFHDLQADLERASGRRIQLHGQNSTLGMGCNAGIKTALKNAPGNETFGFVCCPLSPQEVEKKKLVVYPLALEPVMIVVNKANPVSDLSIEQVRAIMRGDITNWHAVGGNDEPIVLVTRLHCKARPGHWKTILPEAKNFRQQRLNVSSAGDMVQRVEDFKGAIGHIGSTWNFNDDNQLKVISINGYAPSAVNLADKNYPFFRNLSAVTDQHPSADVLAIINEVKTGPAFERVARKYHLLKLDKYEPSRFP